MITDTSVSNKSVNTVEKPVILVVDDSRVIRHALKKMLKKEFTIVEAENGEEAWSRLSDDESIQMIFSDLSMPELDGFGLLDRIRSSGQDRMSKMPFIVMAGNGDEEKTMERALDCGATDLVSKPFRSREIKDRAHAYTSRPTDSDSLSSSTPSLLDDIDAAVDNLSSLDLGSDKKEQSAVVTSTKPENSDVSENIQDSKRFNTDKLASKFEENFAKRAQNEIVEQNEQEDHEDFAQSEYEAEAMRRIEETENNDFLTWKQSEFEGDKDLGESGLGSKIREHVRQKEAMDIVRYEDELENFVAFDVNQKIDSTYRDDRGSNEETEMIRVKLENKLAIEREQQLASCSPFTRFIILSVLEPINTMPWVNLDSKIKNILKRNAR